MQHQKIDARSRRLTRAEPVLFSYRIVMPPCNQYFVYVCSGTNSISEVSPKFWEVLYWHHFQDEGNQLPYDVKVEDDRSCVRIDKPGIGSKGVRVWFENNTLYFEGEKKDKGPLHGARNYAGKFCIPASEYQIDKISAVMNDGVLNIVIPKTNGAL